MRKLLLATPIAASLAALIYTATPARALTDDEFEALGHACANDTSVEVKPDTRVRACNSLLQWQGRVRGDMIYMSRSEAYADLGQLDQAIADLDKFFGLRADVSDKRKSTDPAVKASADAYSKLTSDAYVSRGRLYARKHEPALARQDYDRAVELNRSNASAYYERGVLHHAANEYAAAISQYNVALTFVPDYAMAYLNRGRANFKIDRIKAAIFDYRQATVFAPSDPAGYNALAWVRATAKDPADRDAAEAVKMAEKAVTLSRNSSHLDTLAAAYVAVGSFERAFVAYEEAMALGGAPRIKAYQEDMVKRGFYKGAADATYGPQTQAALRACIQAHCQLLAD